MDRDAYHRPVMVREVIGQLVRREGIYVDGTLGGGGHSLAILQALQEKGFEQNSLLVGIDQDRHAIEEAEKKLEQFRDKTRLVPGNFREVAAIVGAIRDREAGAMPVAGILLDLGVSSFQVDTPERGFSYTRSGPLDMRMEAGKGFTASDIVNNCEERALAGILFRFGEEQKSRRIARAIVAWRSEKGDITDTRNLAAIVKSIVKDPARQTRSLARVFQALRIAVNDELGALEEVLQDGAEMLAPLGRMAVISYHSLEDRMVKRFFTKIATDDWGPKGVGLRKPLQKAEFRVVTGKPEEASDNEIKENPRARSAKLRVIEKKEQSGE
ncbi:MAG: 16S rRNA (cytosine(1402)-N(4))-methyltransferase RsmH [Chlorobiales bacterium]|nr:16S rRNA (cytosine(1402)-N(4))-methyltransferase RsmH [Chlorobiales bacterium]